MHPGASRGGNRIVQHLLVERLGERVATEQPSARQLAGLRRREDGAALGERLAPIFDGENILSERRTDGLRRELDAGDARSIEEPPVVRGQLVDPALAQLAE